jgi:hypothetical protein
MDGDANERVEKLSRMKSSHLMRHRPDFLPTRGRSVRVKRRYPSPQVSLAAVAIVPSSRAPPDVR